MDDPRFHYASASEYGSAYDEATDRAADESGRAIRDDGVRSVAQLLNWGLFAPRVERIAW